MTYLKEEALKLVNRLHQENRLTTDENSAIFDALDEIELLRDRDEQLENLWEQLADIPIDPETECIEEPFLGWGVGISREEIWHWFDARHSKGVAYLLYGGAEDYVPETKRLYALKKNCIECESLDCRYNHNGECRFALVHERKPHITEDSGCSDYNFKE